MGSRGAEVLLEVKDVDGGMMMMRRRRLLPPKRGRVRNLNHEYSVSIFSLLPNVRNVI